MTAFAVLMHDAQEAFLGDVTSPLKQLLPDYKKIEKAFEMVIRDKFKIRIKAEMEIVVKTADILALKAEKQAFIQTPAELAEHWRFLDKFPTVPISPREYINSKALFKDAFNYYNKALNLGLEEIK